MRSTTALAAMAELAGLCDLRRRRGNGDAGWRLGTAEKTPTAASRLGGVGVFPQTDLNCLNCDLNDLLAGLILQNTGLKAVREGGG